MTDQNSPVRIVPKGPQKSNGRAALRLSPKKERFFDLTAVMNEEINRGIKAEEGHRWTSRMELESSEN